MCISVSPSISLPSVPCTFGGTYVRTFVFKSADGRLLHARECTSSTTRCAGNMASESGTPVPEQVADELYHVPSRYCVYQYCYCIIFGTTPNTGPLFCRSADSGPDRVPSYTSMYTMYSIHVYNTYEYCITYITRVYKISNAYSTIILVLRVILMIVYNY